MPLHIPIATALGKAVCFSQPPYVFQDPTGYAYSIIALRYGQDLVLGPGQDHATGPEHRISCIAFTVLVRGDSDNIYE